jgi:DNA-binding GntR family transcriptional regulator
MSGAAVRTSGRDRALTYLREQVLSDPTMEGAFLSEEQIATQVGVSRTPVREALLILASEGLLQMVPQRGVFVSPLSGREIRELMDLRGVIERHAVDLLGDAAPATAEAMDEVLAAQLTMAGDSSPQGARGFIELDRRFHQVLVDAAGSTLLSRTYAGLRERQIRVGIAALQTGDRRWSTVCSEHAAIVDAVRAGDSSGARTAIDDHLGLTLQALLAV